MPINHHNTYYDVQCFAKAGKHTILNIVSIISDTLKIFLICPNDALRYDVTSFPASCQTKCHCRWSDKRVVHLSIGSILGSKNVKLLYPCNVFVHTCTIKSSVKAQQCISQSQNKASCERLAPQRENGQLGNVIGQNDLIIHFLIVLSQKEVSRLFFPNI